jgi:integrase
MARLIGRLNARKVKNAKPGKDRRGKDRRAALIADGGNLFLQVSTGTDGHIRRSWVFQYELHGKRGWMGLGPLHTFSLHEARDKAKQLRQQVKDGIDPLTAKTEQAQQQRLEAAKQMTFRQCADAYCETHDSEWKNRRHAAQWRMTLTEYCKPIADLPVKSIDTDLVLSVLTPIWKTKTVTAKRLRGRIEDVLAYAKSRKLRDGDNPAAWEGLKEMLPDPGKFAKVTHHPALPYTEMPAFMAKLRSRDLLSARALEFTILTASRTSEAIGACWSEIDLAEKIWTVPAARIKASRDHRVPLSDRAIAILKERLAHPHGDRIFNLADETMRRMLRRMHPNATTHGFRSSFKDWASERTSYENYISEAALAHAVGDKVEAAYRRGTALDKRRKLMDAWASFCAKPPVEKTAGTNVTPIRRKASAEASV